MRVTFMLAGAGLVLLTAACDRSTADCGGFCGDGTVCEAGKCVVAPAPAVEPEPEPEPTERGKRRRRRGSRRGGEAADDGGGGEAAGLPDQDGDIPRYRADRDEVIGEGSERLSDRRIREELGKVEPAFDRCLSRATQASDADLQGRVTFKLGIEPSGKVWGVNATLPSSWDVPGLRACLRRAVYEHRFPSWDGPAMGVDYHFDAG